MKKEDLIPGETYYSHYGRGWLVRFSHMDGETRVMHIGCMDTQGGTPYFNTEAKGWGKLYEFNQGQGARLATEEEKQWLLSAIEAKKWIPKPEFTNTYQIY